jgi:hypothetical protein
MESGVSTRRRRKRLRAAITIGIVVLMLFFSFWYAYSYYRAANEGAAPGAPGAGGCGNPTTSSATATSGKSTGKPGASKPASPAKTPAPSDITLNVYNATDRDGLAAKTASQLDRRGFAVATVSNDPLNRTIKTSAEVRHGKSGSAAARVVLAQVEGAKAKLDSRSDGSVDLVLGNAFTALAPVTQPPDADC